MNSQKYLLMMWQPFSVIINVVYGFTSMKQIESRLGLIADDKNDNKMNKEWKYSKIFTWTSFPVELLLFKLLKCVKTFLVPIVCKLANKSYFFVLDFCKIATYEIFYGYFTKFT